MRLSFVALLCVHAWWKTAALPSPPSPLVRRPASRLAAAVVTPPPPSPPLWRTQGFARTTAAVALVSAPLGMLLDNQHGLFHVLEYAAYPFQLTWANKVVLKTALWVPALFAFAGFAMSAIILVLDDVLRTSPQKRAPSMPKVLYGISAFSAQYYLSGLLDFTLRAPSGAVTHVTLAALAAVGFAVFDGTAAGLLLAVATAVAGPLTEVLLVNVPHLYTYTHADLLGVCSWIPWVYAMGAPAVGNLARKVHTTVTSTTVQK